MYGREQQVVELDSEVNTRDKMTSMSDLQLEKQHEERRISGRDRKQVRRLIEEV